LILSGTYQYARSVAISSENTGEAGNAYRKNRKMNSLMKSFQEVHCLHHTILDGCEIVIDPKRSRYEIFKTTRNETFIPQGLLEDLGYVDGDTFDLWIDDGDLMIKVIPNREWLDSGEEETHG
jgi:hypothetical protein